MRVKRILAAIELEHNLSTLDAAFSIAEKFDAELAVLHVIDDPLVEAEKSVYPLGEDGEIQQARAEKKLRKLIDGLVAKRSIANEVKPLVVRGKLGKIVQKEISRLDIDLLVIGHRSEWPLEHFLFGRGLNRIVDKSSCVVLVVPEPDENDS